MSKRGNNTKQNRSKALAIVLSILFGPWAWIYTYHGNARKFWGSIILIFVVLVITVTLSWPSGSYRFTDIGTFTLFPLIIFIVFHDLFSAIISFFFVILLEFESIGRGLDLNLMYVFLAWSIVWVWAIIDSIIKSKIMYKSEPEEKDKKKALIIAILFNYNAWLYTYNKDAWKFWSSFVVVTIFIPSIFILVSQFLPGHGAGYLIIGFIMIFWLVLLAIIWLLAIVDSLPKSKKWRSIEYNLSRDEQIGGNGLEA
ncbi:hypothetical protein ACFLW4_01455 [Chloroflexota bacterium]